jgi:hypothetical protein
MRKKKKSYLGLLFLFSFNIFGYRDIPEGFVSIRTSHFIFWFPLKVKPLILEIKDKTEKAWVRILKDLGESVKKEKIRIFFLQDQKMLKRLVPTNLQSLSPWTIGVAYPHLNLVVIFLDSPFYKDTLPVFTVLCHELSHIALLKVTKRVPRWFSEGFAVYQSKEFSFARAKTLFFAAMGNKRIPLKDLDKTFPKRFGEVNLAYAQSTDFVYYLIRKYGPEQFALFIKNLKEHEFCAALRITYKHSCEVIEERWWHDLEKRYNFIPLLTGGASLWVGLSFLVIIAFIKRRQKAKKKIKQWEIEEEIKDDIWSN